VRKAMAILGHLRLEVYRLVAIVRTIQLSVLRPKANAKLVKASLNNRHWQLKLALPVFIEFGSQ
jgi:hypothetical protein